MMKRLLQKLREDIRGFGFKQWFLIILNAALVLAAAASLAGLRMVAGTLESLTAAERFQGDGELRYAQIACYLPVGDGKTEDDIYTFHQSLESRLVEQSLKAAENGRLYLDAYCGTGKVTITGETGSASVEAVGVGGDFFYFHPLQLRSGSYIRSGDIMDDLVVLDEEMAWKLFGGVDLAGMPVTINGESFVVSGVVSRERDFATKEAYAGDGGVYMSFSAMSRLLETASITGYEVVMPNPITGFAKEVVSENFPVGNGDVVENSNRYGLLHLVEVAGDFGRRSMRTNGVIYPYWENAVRLTEDYAALLLLLAVMLALCPFLSALVLVIRDVRRAYRFAKVKIPEKVDETMEKRKEKRLEKSFEKKAGGDS